MTKRKKVQILTHTKRIEGNPRVDAEIYLLDKIGVDINCIDANNNFISVLYLILERLPIPFQVRIIFDFIIINSFSKKVTSDVLCICHDYYSALYCHWKKIPYILNMEEYYPGEYPDNDIVLSIVSNNKKKVLLYLSKTCKSIVVESEAVSKVIKNELGLNNMNTYTLPNKPLPINAGEAKFRPPSKYINIVYFGYITRKRNIQSYINLLHHREDITLTLIGPGNRRYISELKTLSKIKQRFYVEESLDLASLFGTLKNYDLSLVYFKSRERHHRFYTMPNKYWQSFYSTLPVVVAKHSAMADQVRELDIGLVIDIDNEEWILEVNHSMLRKYKNNIARSGINYCSIDSEYINFNKFINNLLFNDIE